MAVVVVLAFLSSITEWGPAVAVAVAFAFLSSIPEGNLLLPLAALS